MCLRSWPVECLTRRLGGDLNVSENTVKTHVKNVLGKLHMKNRAEAVAYASRLGTIG